MIINEITRVWASRPEGRVLGLEGKEGYHSGICVPFSQSRLVFYLGSAVVNLHMFIFLCYKI